ncbi:MAG TPA: membrane protein insertase YidC, partial [Cellvibrio sp.]
MDWQKNILIAAILAVLFTLAVRWHSYQEQHAPVAQATNSLSASSVAPVTSASDIPAPAANADTKAATPAPVAVSTAVIKVKTDTLLMDINPVGGDIVRVALPRHSADLKTPDVPFVLIDNTANHTYQAQSGIVGANATDNAQGRPTFIAEKSEYTLEPGQDKLIVDLHLDQGQVKITKRFTFTHGDYLVSVEYLIDNQSSEKWSGEMFGRIVRDSQNFTKTNALAMSPFLGGAITTPENKYHKVNFKDLDKAPVEVKEQGGWV